VTCKAIREGDEMACSCGLRWGVDDDDRPQCRADLDGTPHSTSIESEEKASLSDPNVGKDALKELHHIVEDKES